MSSEKKVKKTPFYSWKAGSLAKGCALCVQGKKVVLFVTGLCAQRCYYCPVSEQKFGKDRVFANEWEITDSKNPIELLEEIRLTNAKGAGITGGDPLANVDRTCAYIRLLKKRFGEKFHIHLYTPLILVSEERLQKLAHAGLDEIRFHLNLDDSKLWSRLDLAQLHKWDVGIEVPIVPKYEKKLKALIDFVRERVDFVNLNELERSDTATPHYRLDEMGFKQKNRISYGIKGSDETALKILNYAAKKGLACHYCTAKLKDGVQVVQRLKRRSKNVATKTDTLTSEGTIIRGCSYLPETAPGVGYKRKLAQFSLVERASFIKRLIALQKKIQNDFGVLHKIDERKLRLLTTVKFAKENSKQMKKFGLISAIVEEHPTEDGLEVEVEFL